MLIVISPAKTLDYKTPVPTGKATQPQFLDEAAELNAVLRKYSAPRLARLMGISKELAELNAARNHAWSPPFRTDNARQAIFAFKGDVYVGLESYTFSADDLTYAQQHLRILSGLYGALRPLDLIQPYRLEMGTGLPNPQGRNLYDFWRTTVTAAINEALAAQQDDVLVNLASREYFSVLQPKLLAAQILTPVFQDYSKGQYKVVSFFAKKARGRMTAWIIRNRVTDAAALLEYDEDGYEYSLEASEGEPRTTPGPQERQLIFRRKA